MDADHSGLSQRFVRNYHYLGCFMIVLVAGPLHFAYEWLNENFFVSLIAPINESIWEHLKLVFWPTLLWWVLGYIIFKKKKKLSGIRWVQAMTVSIVIGIMVVVVWYYTWLGAFRVEETWVNFSSLIGVFIGQFLAIHVYRVAKPRLIYLLPSILIIVIIAFMSGYFTYYPPSFPIFVSPY